MSCPRGKVLRCVKATRRGSRANANMCVYGRRRKNGKWVCRPGTKKEVRKRYPSGLGGRR